jgi:hypothetical protein
MQQQLVGTLYLEHCLFRKQVRLYAVEICLEARGLRGHLRIRGHAYKKQLEIAKKALVEPPS